MVGAVGAVGVTDVTAADAALFIKRYLFLFSFELCLYTRGRPDNVT